MIKVITNVTLRVGRGQSAEYAQPGTEVELDDKDAKTLVDRGFVSYPAEVAVKPAEPQTPPPSLDDIVEAILDLNPETDFGKSGKPHVEALEAILGANISGSQRDEAWERYKAEIGDAS